jgi:hypothetical protein
MPQANAVVGRISPLAIASDEFHSSGHRLVDRVADFLDSLPTSAITRGASPSAIREAMDAMRPLPREGAPTKICAGAPTHPEGIFPCLACYT